MSRLTCVGDIVLDRYEDNTYVGGAALNVALFAAKAGVSTSLHATVGTNWGTRILERLKAIENLESCVRIVSGRTATVEVSVRDGERHFSNLDVGVMSGIAECLDFDDLSNAEFVFVPVLIGLEPVAAAVTRHVRPSRLAFATSSHSVPRECLGTKHLDLRSLISSACRAAHIICVGAPGNMLPIVELIAVSNPDVMILHTAGTDGAKVFAAGRLAAQEEAVPVERLDTNGCGDAFLGTYLAAVRTGADAQMAIQRAVAEASRAATYFGPNQLPGFGRARLEPRL